MLCNPSIPFLSLSDHVRLTIRCEVIFANGALCSTAVPRVCELGYVQAIQEAWVGPAYP
jgi:hypothetical protein